MSDFDPLEDTSSPDQSQRRPLPPLSVHTPSLEQLRDRQDRFIALAEDLHSLWRGLPDMSLRQVDARVVAVHARLMELAADLGVSRNGLPELRECCGKKRTWPDTPAPAQEPLGWGLGDIVRRVTRALGFKHCASCEKRRTWLNRLFGGKS